MKNILILIILLASSFIVKGQNCEIKCMISTTKDSKLDPKDFVLILIPLNSTQQEEEIRSIRGVISIKQVDFKKIENRHVRFQFSSEMDIEYYRWPVLKDLIFLKDYCGKTLITEARF
jgi:hypothetical protein